MGKISDEFNKEFKFKRVGGEESQHPFTDNYAKTKFGGGALHSLIDETKGRTHEALERIEDEIMPFQSQSDFAHGTLIITDIPANVQTGDSFILELTGKSYSRLNPPFVLIAQGYLYGNEIINYTGSNISGNGIEYIKFFEKDGVLCAWFPRISYWNSFSVILRSANNKGGNQNRVKNIINSAEPEGSKKVTVNLYKTWNSINDGAGSGLDADKLDGLEASQFLQRKISTTTINGTNYVNIAKITGSRLGSYTKLIVSGTSGSNVVNSYCNILVNHNNSIVVKSASGNYTQLNIKIVSNGNESYNIALKKTNENGNDTPIIFEIESHVDDIIEVYNNNPALDYSSYEHVHTTIRNGESLSSSYGAELNINGNCTVTGTYSPFTGTHIAYSSENYSEGELVYLKSSGFEKNNPKQPIWNIGYSKEESKGIYGFIYERKEIEMNDLQWKYHIACLGDMYGFVDENSEKIEYGDYLCASARNGKVKKYIGSDMRCVVGRAGQDWNPGEEVKIAITKE